MPAIELAAQLARYSELLHELAFRDKIKSAEFHYSVGFGFDGEFGPYLLQELFAKMSLLCGEFEFNSFKIGVSWPVGIDDLEKAHLRHVIQTPLILKIKEGLGKTDDFDSPDLEFLIDFNKRLVLLSVKPVYVEGRYTKASREIAQTEYFCNMCRGRGCWYCNETGHFCEESVEQLIGAHATAHFGGKLLILHGAGREDMDVLMLGSGRPFIAEILMPKKRSADLLGIENEINSACRGKIAVSSLRMCSAGDVSALKDAHHDKVYAALVHADRDVDFSKLEANKKLAVLQKTPTRVAGRRADLERSKEVAILRVGEISPQEFVLIMRTSHGTYVKEFISGDNGKTSPSISQITGTHCECMLLDVLEICDSRP